MFPRFSTLIAVAILTVAVGSGSVDARADPNDPVGDSEEATCRVLGSDLNGEPAHDEGVITAVAEAIAEHYRLPVRTAVDIEIEQVKTYCPALFPDIEQVAVYIQHQDEQSDGVT
ncbi:hypothetical protein MFM001_21740 [Mycobacterium sp. MFM001]|uniref:hypothetical protein n=1 Tax=Mycobacterium sp. MFM001 TaxID=2049453 RepID=UPI000DA59F34|nr:hypothetical protein [Mycobacterium sp. MFM001]GBE65712.1 hypothetical protein MFM001_21740 [Mycobacterium sp. MFM001]